MLFEERLNAITLDTRFVKRHCPFCKMYLYGSPMWRVKRQSHCGDRDWYYCQECVPTKELVLYIIDTDKNPYEMVGAESIFIKHKDCTTLLKSYNELLPPDERKH